MFVQHLPKNVQMSMIFVHHWVDIVLTSHVHWVLTTIANDWTIDISFHSEFTLKEPQKTDNKIHICKLEKKKKKKKKKKTFIKKKDKKNPKTFIHHIENLKADDELPHLDLLCLQV